MATRAAASDAAQATASSSDAALAAAQLAPQPAIDAAAYEPPSISAYANAAAVAASTAVLAPAASGASAAVTRSRAASAAPPTPTPAPPSLRKLASARPSSKFGTVNYSVDEMRRLNDKVRAVMPIAGEDWLHVAYQFNYMRPESIPYREVESLKRKFKKMYCMRAGGGGKLPDYAQEAKELRRQINQRTERAQIPLESVHSDSQSEIDAQDAAPSGGGVADEVAATAEGASAPSNVESEPAPTTEVATTGPALDHAESAAGEAVTSGDDGRDIAARLRLMEDEYHRSMAAKRAPSGATTTTMATLSDPLSGSVAVGAGAFYGDSVSATAPFAASDATTTGIINLLKHSIERKRRTIEEQMLSESERVRKERKKRKMEQVLYNIHREQTGGDGSASMVATASNGSSFQHSLPATMAAASPCNVPTPSAMPTAWTAGQDTTSSLGVMEIVLQFLIAQQQETARREQQDEERRRIESEERERRRRLKDAQRRKDKHEMMLVMAALLQENFPVELRQYLDPSSMDSDGVTGTTTPAHTPNGSKPRTADTQTAGSAIDRVAVPEDTLL